MGLHIIPPCEEDEDMLSASHSLWKSNQLLSLQVARGWANSIHRMYGARLPQLAGKWVL